MERFHVCSGARFQDLAGEISYYLKQARRHIQAAVCWFTHQDIFEVLLERIRAGVQVELILEYDTQNIRPDGLDFQRFIEKGGHLYAYREAGLMHHKFAVIDGQLLLTGSFNWTYNTNEENLLILEDSALADSFSETFLRLKTKAQRINRVSRADAKVFVSFPLFENTLFSLSDLRKKVSTGTGVWTVRIALEKRTVGRFEGSAVLKSPADATGPEAFFKKSLAPFDPSRLLVTYWKSYRLWDEGLFESFFRKLERDGISRAVLHAVWCWACYIKTGDLLFLVEKRTDRLWAAGVVQSDPQPFGEAAFSSFRAVQWLKTMLDEERYLPGRVSGQQVARYRGSALHALQEVMGK